MMTAPDEGLGAAGDSLPEFYAQETFTDCANQRRSFDVTIVYLPGHGFSGHAHEVTKNTYGGYHFRSFSEGSLPTALARLRGAIRAGLAQRFLIKEGDHWEMPLERLRGRIGDGGVVVDGRMVSWQALQELLSPYEGFEFELKIPLEPDRW